MRTFFSILLILVSIFIQSQYKEYFEFGWNEKYGIVDKYGDEVIEPIYDYCSSGLKRNSPFIVLISQELGGLVMNGNTGEMEKFDVLRDDYYLKVDNKEYIFACNHSDNTSYLLNNFDLNERIEFPKKYEKIIQEGKYLFCYLDDETGDIRSESNFKILKENFPMSFNFRCKTEDGKLIHYVNNKSGTVFFDEDLNEIASTEDYLEDFIDLNHFLQTQNITIVEDNNAIEVGDGWDASQRKFPIMDAQLDATDDKVILFNIYKSRTDFQPFFKFKRKHYKISNYGPEDKIRLSTTVDNTVIMHLIFHVDLENKIIFLPKKYWKDIELQLIAD